MITDEELKLSAYTYLKGIIDFVKWTSTIAIATIIWIGSNLTTIKGSMGRIIIMVSLIVLGLSLICAIITFNRVLEGWSLKWECDLTSLIILRSIQIEGTKVSAENIDPNQINRFMKANEDIQSFNKPKIFKNYVAWHVILLVIGLWLYICAQILSNFRT